MSYILAGDIGGTKTHLALFPLDDKKYLPQKLGTFHSREAKDLESIISRYLKQIGEGTQIRCISLALAGPVKEGRCKITNLPWVIDAKLIADTFKIPQVYLLNDLQAAAYSLDILEQKDIFELQSGNPNLRGNKAIISPGTGLGEAGLYWDGNIYQPFATEGGQTDFGPKDSLQIELLKFFIKRFGNVCYEYAISGPGLYNLFTFFQEVKELQVEPEVLKEMEMEDPAYVISRYGLNGQSRICESALDLFTMILGQEASNLALKHLSLTGLYLGGGIPPKILPKLKEPAFIESFLNKGRFRPLLKEMPVRVILDDKASLKGAAHFVHLLQK